jgi:anti-anti-sigma factor
MEIQSTRVGDIIVLKPRGEFKSRGKLAATLWSFLHRGHNKFIINFEAVRSINSVGLRVLLEFQRLAESAGGSLGLCCVSDALLKVFEAARMRDALSFHADEDAALLGMLGGLPVSSHESSISRYRN